MSSVETYRLAPPEPIRFTYMIDGVLSAAPVYLDITRNSVTGGVDEVDVYDWEDATFKTLAAVISPIAAMSPVPGRTGRSRVDWNVSAIVNAVAGGDVYAVTFYSDVDGTLPIGEAEIRVRNVDAIFANEADIAADLGGQIGNVTIDVNAHVDTLPATLAGAHGAGSWATATGFATAADVAASTAAIEAYGQAHWVTADVSGVPAAVWATAYGTPSANTFGWLAWRLAQWGTEIAQKRIVGQNLLLQSIGGGTTYASVPLKDISGGVIDPAPGEPAQYLP